MKFSPSKEKCFYTQQFFQNINKYNSFQFCYFKLRTINFFLEHPAYNLFPVNLWCLLYSDPLHGAVDELGVAFNLVMYSSTA